MDAETLAIRGECIHPNRDGIDRALKRGILHTRSREERM
jgi:hypothetical protein